MRKQLYQDLHMVLKSIPGIKHVDLWNRNVEFLEEDEAFPMPAVFIEFGQIDWAPLNGSLLNWHGTGNLNLHIVTEWNGSAEPGTAEMKDNLLGWRLAEKIHKAIEDLRGDGYYIYGCTSSISNHDHEDIVDNIEVYRFKVNRTLSDDDAR